MGTENKSLRSQGLQIRRSMAHQHSPTGNLLQRLGSAVPPPHALRAQPVHRRAGLSPSQVLSD